MIEEFIKKYGNDIEMLLKILTTMYKELIIRYYKFHNKMDKNDYEYGKMGAWRDLLDYFDVEFLENDFDEIYNFYKEKYEEEK